MHWNCLDFGIRKHYRKISSTYNSKLNLPPFCCLGSASLRRRRLSFFRSVPGYSCTRAGRRKRKIRYPSDFGSASVYGKDAIVGFLVVFVRQCVEAKKSIAVQQGHPLMTSSYLKWEGSKFEEKIIMHTSKKVGTQGKWRGQKFRKTGDVIYGWPLGMDCVAWHAVVVVCEHGLRTHTRWLNP